MLLYTINNKTIITVWDLKMKSIKKTLSKPVLIFTTLVTSSMAYATTYTYELSENQTWSDTGTSTSSTQNTTVRAYVPGDKSINYTTVPIYTSTYSSTANSLGDVVGSVYNIYGTSPAWVDPYNEAKYSIMYPTYNVMRTRLTAVNDDRLAIGHYMQVGGSSRGFIYDLLYKQYTKLNNPSGLSSTIVDINNNGTIIGSRTTADGSVSFVYDCVNDFQDFVIPDATSSSVNRIDDEGKIYGRVYGIEDIDASYTYYIASPDSLTDTSECYLVARDDVAEPIAFSGTTNVEMSGDAAQLVKIGDFDQDGFDDIFVYHEMGKYILYLGEDGFENKIKNFADWGTIEYITGVTPATEWDFNNDGLTDKLVGNQLFLAKSDGEYYYVPQTLPVGSTAAYGDFNGDGLLDVASFSGAFISVAYQSDQPVTDPVIEPEPTTIDPAPAGEGNIPAIDANADEIEREGEQISEIRENSVLLTSGERLWFNQNTIIKFNDASEFEVGQTLDFKAWINSDGTLIGIKVEIL